MSVKEVSRRNYQKQIDSVPKEIHALKIPKEGWLVACRKSLGMSGAELARKIGVSRSNIAQAESNELSGAATIATLNSFAEAMGCKLVYAIVPLKGQTTDQLIFAQAMKKARAIAGKTHEHMELEGQALFETALEFQIEQLAKRIQLEMPADFWSNS